MAQMPEINKQILEDVEYFRDKYYTYDLPIPFKEGLTMYPVYVKDYNEFLSCSACLTLNKNDTPEGIRMTNIDYLVSKMKDKEEVPLWSLRFTKILELCLHIKSGLKCPKCGKFMSFEEFYKKYDDPAIEDKNSILICECGEKFEETVKFAPDEEDPRKKDIEALLPGVNCGACGYPGCSGLANAMVDGTSTKAKDCKVIKADKAEELQAYLDNMNK